MERQSHTYRGYAAGCSYGLRGLGGALEVGRVDSSWLGFPQQPAGNLGIQIQRGLLISTILLPEYFCDDWRAYVPREPVVCRSRSAPDPSAPANMRFGEMALSAGEDRWWRRQADRPGWYGRRSTTSRRVVPPPPPRTARPSAAKQTETSLLDRPWLVAYSLLHAAKRRVEGQ